ncbi:polycomb protein suz12-like [Saccoglossus kowalevskii]|uniref:Polycomb protein suz12-like n=1 Tax=Saccoglossus kowalevskii TaxID=10224 RepID=A0ABM0MMA9_SACKO|nr:PREDICTED: polycomb protein suz12-like [Saccoglossus kowalevskii]
MAPLKHENGRDSPRKPKFEQLQADHELFLQAFEKPTQIYRFLRTRNLISPVFLHRTLAYMNPRMSRNHTRRKDFKVDSILEKITAKRNAEIETESLKAGYLNMKFTGFFYKKSNLNGDANRLPSTLSVEDECHSVKVEALLLKVCHKKRKDVSSPIMKISLGKSNVAINPLSSSVIAEELNTLSIASDKFSHANGHTVKSYVLVLRVNYPLPTPPPMSETMLNGEDQDSYDEPPKKRSKVSKYSCFEDDDIQYITYGAELVVYDKHRRCLLTDGDYELALQELGSRVNNRRTASWETIMDGKPVGPFEVFNIGPTLKFTLSWMSTATTDRQVCHVSRQLHTSPHKSHSIVTPEAMQNGNQEDEQSERDKDLAAVEKCRKELIQEPRKKQRIFYQFLYNNNTRQQTEARDDLHCPWCSLNCMKLYSLLKHLKLCHSRFTFTYMPHPKGARIDVSINERYDGSYSGNPQDLFTGYAFSRNGPCRRTPVTQVLVFRPGRPRPSLSEFLEPDDKEVDATRPFVSGHNRLYYHTHTCIPVRPEEIEVDSEEETDPDWLRKKTQLMIDEFTDVNEGEKELMKLWNLHVMKHNYIADGQMPVACRQFVVDKGEEIIRKELYRNFLFHLVNLYDFSLINACHINTTMAVLNNVRDKMKSTTSV